MAFLQGYHGGVQILAKALPAPRPWRGPAQPEVFPSSRWMHSVRSSRAPPRRRAFERGRLAPDLRPRRAAVIAGLILAYAWYYVCRYSLTYAGPALVQQQRLDLRKLGLILSAGQIAIGLSKVLTSVFTVDLPASRCLVMGLLLTGACNVAAAFLPACWLTLTLAVLWSFNGLFQGFGSPSCARVISAWCLPKERGLFWSIWNCSNNLGGALAPIVVSIGLALSAGHWRGSLLLAGLSAMPVALAVAGLVREAPPDRLDGRAEARVELQAPVAAAGDLTGSELLLKGCLGEPGLVQLALANFFIFGVRAALMNWLAFHLFDGSTKAAAPYLSAFEFGGLLGSVFSGSLSDRWWQARGDEAPLTGSRIQVAVAAVTFILLPAALLLACLDRAPKLHFAAMFAGGFGLYVAQALSALCGLESVSARAAGVSQGLLGWAAYTGAAAAGLPLGWLIQGPFGWKAWRLSLALGSALISVLLLPLWRLPSYEQRARKVRPRQPRLPNMSELMAKVQNHCRCNLVNCNSAPLGDSNSIKP
ncbi:uhpC [Symbiodinium sp. CCMP2456]|nr:uhpC [Symbiodinium sp. CCMP2456]